MDYILMGGGGLAMELCEYILRDGHHIVGYYALEEDADLSEHIHYLGDEHDGVPRRDGAYLLASGLISLRRKMIDFMEQEDLPVGNFISSQAYVSSFAEIGNGAVITPLCALTGNPIIGTFLFMNVGSELGHHTKIGNNVVIGPGAIVTGHCMLEHDITLGANASMVPGTHMEAETEIGLLSYPRRRVKRGTITLTVPGITMN